MLNQVAICRCCGSQTLLKQHRSHSPLMGSCAKTLLWNHHSLTHTVISLRTWLAPSLLAADTCQLRRKLQCTSLMPAFRCCRLTHARTIKLTRSWFAQTRAGMAWGKTLLVSSTWLIPSGCAVNRTDIHPWRLAELLPNPFSLTSPLASSPTQATRNTGYTSYSRNCLDKKMLGWKHLWVIGIGW